MIRFLVIYCSLYLLMHFYAYSTIKRGLIISKLAKVISGLFILVMISGPIIVRLGEKAGYEAGSRLLAYICFTWMGLIFLFISYAFLFDLLRCCYFIIRPCLPDWLPKSLVSARVNVFALLSLTIALYVYGLFEAANIQIVYHQIYSVKIPADPGRVRVVQISDVHLGLLTKENKLRKILNKVKAVKPDVLVSTGDLVDGQLNNIAAAAKLLADMKVPLGKFAVLGNHEIYAGLENSLKFTEDAGFIVLRNKGVVLDGLTIIGVDDRAFRSIAEVQAKREQDILTSYSSDKFKIFLKHRPSMRTAGPDMFDLQLSGHTHKGQIFPFNLLTWFPFPSPTGELVTINGSILYISPGTGTWGPPIRIMAPPEVTVIDLLHDNQ